MRSHTKHKVEGEKMEEDKLKKYGELAEQLKEWSNPQLVKLLRSAVELLYPKKEIE